MDDEPSENLEKRIDDLMGEFDSVLDKFLTDSIDGLEIKDKVRCVSTALFSTLAQFLAVNITLINDTFDQYKAVDDSGAHLKSLVSEYIKKKQGKQK